MRSESREVLLYGEYSSPRDRIGVTSFAIRDTIAALC